MDKVKNVTEKGKTYIKKKVSDLDLLKDKI